MDEYANGLLIECKVHQSESTELSDSNVLVFVSDQVHDYVNHTFANDFTKQLFIVCQQRYGENRVWTDAIRVLLVRKR